MSSEPTKGPSPDPGSPEATPSPHEPTAGNAAPAHSRPPERNPVEDPLSPEQKEEFIRAAERAGKVRGATKIAAFNGWTLVAVGGLSVLIGLTSLKGLLVGGALLALGWNELRGRTFLLGFDAQGPRTLGWNQLILLGAIVFYCVDGIFGALGTPEPQIAQLEELTGMEPGTVGQFTAMAYGAVILGTALFQGLLSRYYFMREKPLREYLEETPPWIVELLRRARPE